MKKQVFPLLATENKIKFEDGSEKISLSAPIIVSNDSMLSRVFADCRKLKLAFRLIGFFQPLLSNNPETLSKPFEELRYSDGQPFSVCSRGVSFAVFRNRLFECADKCDFELLYQGFLDWQKQKNNKGDNSDGSQSDQ